ncbi:MAG TPA: hypothetical protein DIW64_19035 [Cellvibrio sp.]|nr:hypothetical protein [Cellvibrio sp.]
MQIIVILIVAKYSLINADNLTFFDAGQYLTSGWSKSDPAFSRVGIELASLGVIAKMSGV